jgi:hypothetical protein
MALSPSSSTPLVQFSVELGTQAPPPEALVWQWLPGAQSPLPAQVVLQASGPQA